MLIGIVAASNIRHSPYIFYYSRILEENGIDYELIYPDQKHFEDKFEKTYYPIEWNSKNPRAIEFFLYSRKVIKIINQKKYDGLIMLTSITATYCSLFLGNKYKHRYIVDIRDYTHENIMPYYFLERNSILHSAVTVISSPEFHSFLPKAKYTLCHNINFVPDSRERTWVKPTARNIVIGYVGSLVYKENCLSLMKLVANDDRFELRVFGNEPGDSRVQDAIKKLNNERISYHGAYEPAEKEAILDSVDVLFNTYGNGCPLLDTALSNKLYDALYYKKLLLTSPNTAMETMGGLCAYSIDYASTDNLDGLYEWIMSLDEDTVREYQRCKFQEFLADNENTRKLIAKAIMNWNN